jgi:hypothetical protein
MTDDDLFDGRDIPPESFALPRAPEALRLAVFQRTARVVRGRRIRRRLYGFAAIALAFAAGLAVDRLASRDGPAPAPVPRTDSRAPRPALAARELLSAVLAAPREEKTDLLRRAGDRFLTEGDLENALRAYRQILELGDRNASPAPSDTWLLAALKTDSTPRR